VGRAVCTAAVGPQPWVKDPVLTCRTAARPASLRAAVPGPGQRPPASAVPLVPPERQGTGGRPWSRSPLVRACRGRVPDTYGLSRSPVLAVPRHWGLGSAQRREDRCRVHDDPPMDRRGRGLSGRAKSRTSRQHVDQTAIPLPAGVTDDDVSQLSQDAMTPWGGNPRDQAGPQSRSVGRFRLLDDLLLRGHLPLTAGADRGCRRDLLRRRAMEQATGAPRVGIAAQPTGRPETSSHTGNPCAQRSVQTPDPMRSWSQPVPASGHQADRRAHPAHGQRGPLGSAWRGPVPSRGAADAAAIGSPWCCGDRVRGLRHRTRSAEPCVRGLPQSAGLAGGVARCGLLQFEHPGTDLAELLASQRGPDLGEQSFTPSSM
jgi:hypothetical protein